MLLLLSVLACGGGGDDVVEATGDPPIPSCEGDATIDAVVTVQPFLQQLTAGQVWVVWETDVGTESRVVFGPADAMDRVACGERVPVRDGTSVDDAPTQVHHALLDGLEADTRYQYEVHTGTATAGPFYFRTPSASPEAATRIVAMSDAQYDSRQPDQFRVVVEDGVIPWATANWHPELDQAVSYLLVPGDLVDNGWEAGSWAVEFFTPAEQLLRHVPIYPAIGNHEGGTPHYFRYFKLPEANDTLGEHAYAFDQANTRVLTLDSNGFYELEQLAWLEGQLADACGSDDIDFVFAQLHHPWLSELWIPGESDFTGEVVERLTRFSTDCGKPSVHFFGHTHGYSRGQTLDHQHVMVNVASAGGALDRWGITEQADYDAFSVSQDTYGFVAVEITGGEAPSFTVRRINLGYPEAPVGAEQSDVMTVWRYNEAPATPALSADSCVETRFSGGPFSDPEGHRHQASQWQLASDCSSFDTPLVDLWRQDRNEYFGQDTQAGDDLTDEVLDAVLQNPGGCLRVRYRDEGLVWSEWSDVAEVGSLCPPG